MMIIHIIKKIISVVIISSLLACNILTYVRANDFKLSIIYMLDAIEDMEYKEREQTYKEEHEDFLIKDEQDTNDNSTC